MPRRSLNQKDQDNRETKRVLFVCATWAVALIATFPHPAGFLYLVMFPAGLAKPFTRDLTDPLGVGVGWLVYFGLTAYAIQARKREVFIALYVILCILLSLNVVGCRSILNGIDAVH